MKRLRFNTFVILISLLFTSCSYINRNLDPEGVNTPTIKSDKEDKVEAIYTNNQFDGFKDIASFIPEGWNIVEPHEDSKVEGDLNNDGTTDIAFVVEGIRNEDLSPPRMLMIITCNKDNTYNLAVKAEKAILKEDEGGIMGEPFMGLSIDNGSLLISHYGGSAWRWSSTYRFRYEKDGWYLIGATEDWFHAVSSAGRKYEDINLLTGDYEKIETDDNGIEKKIKGNRGKKTLINLVDFIVNGERQF